MTTVEREMVAAWNSKVPVGAMVRYWRGVREGEPSGVGPTETSARQLSNGAAVVFITGTAGCIALSHVELAEAGEEYRPSRRPVRPPVVIPAAPTLGALMAALSQCARERGWNISGWDQTGENDTTAALVVYVAPSGGAS